MATFEKVGECLYRYAPTGTYYARFESNGREIRRSLDTDDRALAKRRLADLQRSIAKTVRGGGKVTLAQLCDRYLATTRNQAPATIYREEAIARRIKANWPGGADVPISKVLMSHIAAWLASYSFGVPSYNLHLLFIRTAFELAVADRLLSDSPAAGLKIKKAKKPSRKTPTFEEFAAIVADIRAMPHNAERDTAATSWSSWGWPGWGKPRRRPSLGETLTGRTRASRPSARKPAGALLCRSTRNFAPCSKRCAERGGCPSSDERVFRVLNAKKAISAACKRLSLPAYSHRSFRRLFITRAIERGVDVKVIAEWQDSATAASSFWTPTPTSMLPTQNAWQSL